MNKFLKTLTLSFLSLVTLLTTYNVLYYVAENYFFDKLFYKKSVEHGYLDCSKVYCNPQELGNREPETLKLLTGYYLQEANNSKKVLGAKDSETFKIAVLGDSYVFGVGVRKNDRFQNILGEKLNTIRPVEVFSLGFSGDSALDNLIKYETFRKVYDIDLFIFTLVENDLMYRKESVYPSERYSEILEHCNSPISQIVFNTGSENDYLDLLKKSVETEANLCVLKKTIEYYPKDAVYFSADLFHDKKIYLKKYLDILESEGFEVISADKGREIPPYNKSTYWEKDSDYFNVSEKEQHPSKLTHKMYADILFNEITSNSRWGFIVK